MSCRFELGFAALIEVWIRRVHYLTRQSPNEGRNARVLTQFDSNDAISAIVILTVSGKAALKS